MYPYLPHTSYEPKYRIVSIQDCPYLSLIRVLWKRSNAKNRFANEVNKNDPLPRKFLPFESLPFKFRFLPFTFKFPFKFKFLPFKFLKLPFKFPPKAAFEGWTSRSVIRTGGTGLESLGNLTEFWTCSTIPTHDRSWRIQAYGAA